MIKSNLLKFTFIWHFISKIFWNSKVICVMKTSEMRNFAPQIFNTLLVQVYQIQLIFLFFNQDCNYPYLHRHHVYRLNILLKRFRSLKCFRPICSHLFVNNCYFRS